MQVTLPKLKVCKLMENTEALLWSEWKNMLNNYPKRSSAACQVALVQPSSAAAERGFSLLKASYGPQQEQTLYRITLNVHSVQS